MIQKIFLIFSILFCFASYGYMDNNTSCDSIAVMADTNNLVELEPVFIPFSYTCDVGYFLPANTLGCRVCPSGYNCSGGTFDFNENIAQGIDFKRTITQSTDNICSTNLLPSIVENTNVIMEPIFVPNETITVNFINGENTETITCIYDTEFTIPAAPAPRVGYVFTGWKIKNAE